MCLLCVHVYYCDHVNLWGQLQKCDVYVIKYVYVIFKNQYTIHETKWKIVKNSKKEKDLN